jgi:steroid delta-isomerase-like uncharacterized protein
MSTEQNKMLVRRFVEAVDKQDFVAATACLATEALKVHIAGVPHPLDYETFLQFGQMWHAAFPDEQTTFEDQVAEGDKVVSRMASTATHQSDFQGIPATGKKIRVTGIWVDRVAEGKIVERWGVVDMLGVMQQLGVIPAPGQE